ncbi:MAG: efflux RND transporter periplasmic adaptor subunit [Acidobacteria bacterium]|nr:MAG: efflux RND transporter periplasmic adaptor subunit [Acidobacteriota bacterium]
MTPRPFVRTLLPLLSAGLFAAACSRGPVPSAAGPGAAVEIRAAQVVEQEVVRELSVTGTLTADEDAEVAAETGGRVVATLVERGSAVAEGAPLIELARSESEASFGEAEANVAQIEARLALQAGGGFDADRVPEVAAARASKELAETEFDRIKTLLGDRVVSQAEFDQKRTQVEAARNQYQAARNNAAQLYRQHAAATARLSLARKALADTVVRAPFGGLVVERKVSVGDYVTRGTKVVTVVRVQPLRVELTVPERFMSSVKPGQPVRVAVDAYPGRTFEGRVRFVSPALRADQRALVIEALVPNTDGLLKPGIFVSAVLEGAVRERALFVPRAALRVEAGINRLFVLRGDRVEERVVKVGQSSGDLIEIRDGVSSGEQVAVSGLSGLADGARVRVTAGQGASR